MRDSMVVSAPELGPRLRKTESTVPWARVAESRKGGKRQVGRQLSFSAAEFGDSWLLPVA